METTLKSIHAGILEGNMASVGSDVQAAVDAGVEAETILQQGLIPAMAEVGRLFEIGEYFVPEMLIAARAMQAGLAVLKPLLVEAGTVTAGKVVIGTVQGDLHDIGKNLVAMMLEGAGFEIEDLGTDVNPQAFVEAARTGGADLVAISALLTTTMPKMETTIKAFQEAGLRDKVKVIIGGAPVTEDYARKIGADGFASDASRATTLAKQMVA